MIRSVLDWFDDRTGYREIMQETLYEAVPGGARWRYVWGSTLVFTFVLQVITGLLLWAAYSPSTQTAWESVYFIQHGMWLGNVVRGIHHFAAQAMVVLLAIHLIQVIVDGAYKAPREINFWLGMVLMQIVLGLSLTGYLLPWDQKGYYATQVSTKIMGATPVIGSFLQEAVQGGPQYGHHTLTRFFMMHAGLLPGLLVALLALHIYVFRRHGITAREPALGPTAPFWPDQVFKDAVACLGVLAVVLLLALFKGAELSAPADPAQPYAAARPEWYFLFLFRFLKFEAVEHYGLAFGAIYVPGAIMAVLMAMPIIAYIGRVGHWFNVAFIGALSIVIVVLTGMALVEDRANEEHQAAIHEAERDGQRVVELAQGDERIPAAGAGALLAADAFAQGPKIFAKHCAGCHRYDGHDGRGKLLLAAGSGEEKASVALPEAADLGSFGTRPWMRDVLLHFETQFAPIKLSARYQAGGDDLLDPDASEMANWSGDRQALSSAEHAKDLDALVEYLASEAQHANEIYDAKLVERGRELAVDGTWTGALEGNACTACHSNVGDSFVEDSSADSGYPDIRGYGSADWLRAFIRDPGSSQFYGSKNQMPAFADKLSEQELQLLVDWMTRNYRETKIEPYENRRELMDAAVAAALGKPATVADPAE